MCSVVATTAVLTGAVGWGADALCFLCWSLLLLVLLLLLNLQNVMSHMAQLRRLMGVSDDLHKVRFLLWREGVGSWRK